MRTLTRQYYNSFVSQIALLNAIPDATQKFTVDPTIQQKLIDKIQASSAFLSQINIVLVDEQGGSILGLGVSGTIASRTNTSTTDRATKDPSGLTERTYSCKQTNFDTHITYAKLDAWAKFKDFQARIANQVAQAIRLDIITIGFNGVANTAATTDPTTYPLLQDVNIGWLQKLRVEAPSQVMSDGGDTTTGFTTKVTYGTADTADYKNLDALVWDARNTLLPVHARNDSELVVVVSDDLLHDKYFPIINSNDDAENQLARDIIMSTKRLGGLQPVTVHNFPAGTIWITKLSTLSLYRQSGSARRHILDNPKRDRIEDYQSSNDAYVIEDLDFNCLVENIAQHDAA